jgi:hypothetical protein
VKHVVENDCYRCHSNRTRLSWFDQIVPGYWAARQHLNFSTLGSQSAGLQKAGLYEAVNMMKLGAMLLPPLRKLHSEANVTPQQIATLKAYLAPWTLKTREGESRSCSKYDPSQADGRRERMSRDADRGIKLSITTS